MDETVSTTDIKRKLRGALNGRSYLVMSQGRAIARIVPPATPTSHSRAALLSRLAQQPIVNTGSWTREDAYQDEW